MDETPSYLTIPQGPSVSPRSRSTSRSSQSSGRRSLSSSPSRTLAPSSPPSSASISRQPSPSPSAKTATVSQDISTFPALPLVETSVSLPLQVSTSTEPPPTPTPAPPQVAVSVTSSPAPEKEEEGNNPENDSISILRPPTPGEEDNNPGNDSGNDSGDEESLRSDQVISPAEDPESDSGDEKSLGIKQVTPLVEDLDTSVSDSPAPGSIIDLPEADEPNPFGEKPYAAELEWQRQKKEEGAENPAIDKLMSLIGLQEVKDQVLAIKAKVETCKRQGVNLKEERFNIVFQGNPGTGKTTVARIYAEFLESVGVLESQSVKETSGAILAYKGPAYTKRIIKKMMNYGDGVLFVDEAYQLTAPYSSSGGRQALDVILTELENRIGRLVVIFAGYNKEMQSFFEHNPGLISRVPYTLSFTDFDDSQLWRILRDNINAKYNKKMEIEGGIDGSYMRVIVRRLSRGRGIRGFGNARAVKNLLAKISERQAKRLSNERKDGSEPTDFHFTMSDLIGPDPSQVMKESRAWSELQTLIGLDTVKKSVKSMLLTLRTNYRRELRELKPIELSLNQVFVGSPGTGKTTVAKLYGEIMADLGLLSDGEVVVKNPSDFIGACLGKSEAQTRAILSATVGKVLIIDEAYMLASGGHEKQEDAFKTAVVDTLVAEVQGVPGDDRCVLILGYEDKLREMFQNVNPGLSRRFPIEDPFRFEDFTLPELKKILELKMKQQDLRATLEAMRVANGVLERSRMRPNFSNGGEVENCLTKAKLNYLSRQAQKDDFADQEFDTPLQPQDFDPNFSRSENTIANTRKRLQNIVGDDIIQKLEGYQELALAAENHGFDPREEVPTNFVFKGPPGTGKTTAAQSMGKLYYDMGFLSTDEVIECSASDLIGRYVGQTGPKTKSQLDKARGKVLFIDEAYCLAQGEYGTEAVNELSYLLRMPKYAGNMIVILAGHTLDMDKLMAVRPCLSGLFPEEIVFSNIAPQDCLHLLDRELAPKHINAPFLKDRTTSGYKMLLRLVRVLSDFPSWSNARDIKTLAKQMSAAALRSKVKSRDSDGVAMPNSPAGNGIPLSEADAVICIKKMIGIQRERCSNREAKPGTFPGCERNLSGAHHEQSPNHMAQYDTDAVAAQAPRAPSHAPPQSDSNINTQPNINAVASPGMNIADMTITQNSKALDHCREQHIDNLGITGNQTNTPVCYNGFQGDDDEREKERKAQQRLRQMGRCVQGADWVRDGNGYRCTAGVHYVSDGELGL